MTKIGNNTFFTFELMNQPPKAMNNSLASAEYLLTKIKTKPSKSEIYFYER